MSAITGGLRPGPGRLGAVICGLALVASVAAGQPRRDGGVVTVRTGDSLSRLAGAHLGAPRLWPVLMLATNGRLADRELGLEYIGDPNELAIGQRIWVPATAEVEHLIAGWRAYERAVLDMSLPEPWEVRGDLVTAGAETIVAVTWARGGQYPGPYPVDLETGGDVWVTIEPHLQEFCRRLEPGEALVERLEQRLGMPPKSNKTEFVRIEIAGDSKGLFRPCTDPRLDRVACALPADNVLADAGYEWYPMWFYKQYHQAYATARPTRFPWTSLGYTFDWGQADEVGESEFVIREGTRVRVLETVPTEIYCGAPGGG